MKFSRRDFLTFAGFTVLGVAGGRYLKHELMPGESYYLGSDFKKREEKFRSGICGMCPAGCGIQVRLIDGLPVKIDGNPDCPVSRGKLCPKGQMGLELHFNPDRIASPLQRTGSPGSEQWKELSWDEALALLATKVGPALKEPTGKGVAVICHEEHSIGSQLWTDFQLQHGSRCSLTRLNLLRDRAILPALKLTTELTDWPVYDTANSDFLLVFDSPLVSGWTNPTLMIGKYASFRRGRDRSRGEMVFVGSRRSMDASNADKEISVKPYTSAVLALGLAHVIIREHRYDEAFVSKHCSGFEELKTLILKNFSPKTVSELTGVPIETINSTARLFADSERPMAIGERIPEASQAWEQTAYLLLNALKGSIGVKGGVMFQERLEFGEVQPPLDYDIDLKDIDRSPLDTFISSVTDGSGVPDVLMLDNVDPGMAVSPGYNWSDTLKRIPYIVSFSPYPNSTTSLADLVLPDLGFLEKASSLVHSPALGYPSAVVANAPASPIGNGLETQIIQSLLLDEQFVTEGVVDKVKATEFVKKKRTGFHRGIFKARRGLINDTPFTHEWVKRMEAGGWWASDTDVFEEFDEKLLLKGGWSDPYVASSNGDNQVFSDSRKFNMHGVVNTIPLRKILHGKISPVPPAYTNKPWMSLTLVPITILSLSSLPYGNIPHLLEFPEPGVVTGWEPWLEIHSSIASQMGIEQEDTVYLKTHNQESRYRILINDSLHPNIGAYPHGMFGLGAGSWLNENMKVPLESIETIADVDIHFPGIKVQIRKG